jgi:hypothetical protein
MDLAAAPPHLLYQVRSAPRPVANLAIPEAEKDDALVPEPSGGIEHAQIVALVGISLHPTPGRHHAYEA